jgi:hypothetical protein
MHHTHDSVFEQAAAVSRFRNGMIAGSLLSTFFWAIILAVLL